MYPYTPVGPTHLFCCDRHEKRALAEIIVRPNQLDTDPIQDETHQVRATGSGGCVQASAPAATISATISSNKIIFKII